MSARRHDDLPMERLSVAERSQGGPAIHVTGEVSPDEFVAYGRRLVDVLGGSIEHRIDSPFEHLWTVRVESATFHLAADEAGVFLEPLDGAAANRLPLLLERLHRYREGLPGKGAE